MLPNAEFQGQPCFELSLPGGDFVRMALHGAHVLSWKTADGRERLYLSPRAHIDGKSAIRGGVPLCFPQFNLRALTTPALPKHGFARTQAWTVDAAQASANGAQARLVLRSDPATRALWPHEFEASLTVSLAPGRLQLGFGVKNTGLSAWPFALALHTYLRVDGVDKAQLSGLDGLSYWDGVRDLDAPDARRVQGSSPLTFSSETDSVYAAVQAPLQLRHPGGRLAISQSASLQDVVVWNPGAARCATLDDMPPNGFRDMLCVEAARIHAPVLLSPGQSWDGWQALDVLA